MIAPRKVRLADCCEIISGATPKTSVEKYWNGPIAWVTPKDLSSLESKHIDSTPQTLSQAGYNSCSTRLMPAGSVLFSSRAPIGHVAINSIPMCTNQGFKSFVPDSEQLSADYLYYWLKANKPYLQSLGNGATFKEVSKTIISEVKLQLPPLSEQQRIAAILDKADALRAKRREAIAKCDQLLQSVFLDMFGDPVTNPKGWPVLSLPELAEKFCDGPFGSNLKSVHYQEKGVRVIRLQNIGVWKFLGEDNAFISEEHFASLPRNHCRPGDLLIGTLGDPNLRACILPTDVDRALNKADCLLFRVEPSIAISEYVCGLLNCESLIKSASGLALGQTRLRISLGRLKTLDVPVPPKHEQEKYAVAVESIEKLRNQVQGNQDRLDDMFAATQQQAFAGELNAVA